MDKVTEKQKRVNELHKAVNNFGVTMKDFAKTMGEVVAPALRMFPPFYGLETYTPTWWDRTRMVFKPMFVSWDFSKEDYNVKIYFKRYKGKIYILKEEVFKDEAK